MTPPAGLTLWGTPIGAVSYAPDQHTHAVFEYHPDFVDSGIELAPVHMPLRRGTFSFPHISQRTFLGLPGMLADSLPDKFGNQLIDKHLASKGIAPERITAIDRLLYVGARAMGALEYQPAQSLDSKSTQGGVLDLAELTELTNLVMTNNKTLAERLRHAATKQAVFDLLRVGTSAGGARAKALIALDANGNAKVGHIDHGADHTYWLLKFDGIDENRDRDSVDPAGTTVLEYVYSLLARECGIDMPRCQLLNDGERRHFLIERFDRIVRNGKLDKLHYTSWCGMDHAHRDQTLAYSYEQLVLLLRRLRLPQSDVAELYRRAVFNIIGRNHDDHTKNFGFLMNRAGQWSLSPAFDMTYAYDPSGRWTRTHQISLQGKGSDFTRDDLLAFGALCNLSARDAGRTIDRTISAFATFATLAQQHEVPTALRELVQRELKVAIESMH